MAATRRLAAVLAADLVGYSRLMGLDEEGTLVRLRALRSDVLDPNIAENSGRLVKTTGDGFLVEFNSVIDALRCARDVHVAMTKLGAPDPDRRFMLRIGVHQGDIVVEDGDIFGNGVNIAARLEGIAEPGGICVSERVQEDAAGRIDLEFEDIGEQQLKNIARPIRAFRVRLPQLAVEPDRDFADAVSAPSEAPTPQLPEPPGATPPEPATNEPLRRAEPAPAEPEAAAVEPERERAEPAPAAIEPEPLRTPDAAAEPVLFPFLARDFKFPPRATASLPREQLQALLAEWLGHPVEVVEATGAWLPLDPSQRSRLPNGDGAGSCNRLGVDTTIGLRAWRTPTPIVIRIGPLDRAGFTALLPDRPALAQLISLIREVGGADTRFAINPVLAGGELTPARLDPEPPVKPRLGWNLWLPRAHDNGDRDADQASFCETSCRSASVCDEPAAAAD